MALDGSSYAVARLRAASAAAILWLLWLLPPVLGWLAAHGGMGWELVTAFGAAVAVAASLGCHGSVPPRRRRAVLGTGIALAVVLLLGAGQAVLPALARLMLPFGVLALAAGLGDRRALGLAFLVLVPEALLPLAAEPVLALSRVAALAVEAMALLMVQRALRRAARRGEALLPREAARAAPVWTASAAPRMPGVLVQAERLPDGTLRLAVAGAAGLRVTAC